MNQICIFFWGTKSTDIHRSLETITVKSVGYRQENVLFGAYFGGHLEYANEPHLHTWETSNRDTYENLYLYNKNCGLQTGKYGVRSTFWAFWRPHWIYANEPIFIVCVRPQAVIHMNSLDPYNKNCGLQTGWYAVPSIIWPFWWLSWIYICKSAKFNSLLEIPHLRYIWKNETRKWKTVDCRVLTRNVDSRTYSLTHLYYAGISPV